MLSEITAVLIKSNNMYQLIAELGGGAPWMHMPMSFQGLQEPALDPLVA